MFAWSPIVFVTLILWGSVTMALAQKPNVSISMPRNEMLIRANVPVFGSVSMPKGKEGEFAGWTLDYGAGTTLWNVLRLLVAGTSASEGLLPRPSR